MATVPGEADNNGMMPTGMAALPKALQPTQSDFLMAAAIADRQRNSGPAEGVVAKPGQTVQPVDVGGNIARVREEFGRAAAEMTGVADAVRVVRGEMTPEEAQTFALGAIPALVPGGKVAGEAAEVAPGVVRGIRAFHGSPYDFEKFSAAQIGTTEGTAYGHGLYFAENPKVAQAYKTTGGKMYEVNINAEPEHFLDWDKPLNKQSGHVKDALSGILPEELINSPSGRAFHVDASSDEDIKALREAGIPGIKYLDAGSRAAGKGTSNYVVFDDKLIDIIKKYGIAGLIAANVAHFKTGAGNGNGSE
jgi:hypothetical protein